MAFLVVAASIPITSQHSLNVSTPAPFATHARAALRSLA